MDDLPDLHSRLHAHFRNLSNGRSSAPVFALEYDAEETPVDALEKSVRAGLATCPLSETGWWVTRYLPLLVVLAEQGYGYDGPGTDFWPRFEERAGCKLSPELRRQVVHFFEHGASTLGFARPAKSPWADKFHLMAWPITHAVLPRHLQLPFARSLTRIKSTVIPEMSAGTVASLMADTLQSGDHSSRYATLLQEQNLVAALVCMTLGIAGHNWLSADLVSRLSTDMRNAEDVDLAITTAKQIQQRRRTHRLHVHTPAVPPAGLAPVLTLNESANHEHYLAIRFPVVPADILIALAQDAAARIVCLSLWRTTRPIRLTSLLSTVSTPLQMSMLPQTGAELFHPDDLAGLPVGFQEYLAASTCTVNRPLLFVVEQHELTYLAGTRSVSSNSRVVVIDEDGTWRDLGERVGYLLTHACYSLDLTAPPTLARLQECGVSIATSVKLSPIGTPPLRSVGESQFLPGDVVGFRVDGSVTAGLLVEDENAAIPAIDGAMVLVPATIGQHAIQIHDNQGRTLATQRLRVVDGYACQPVVTITLTENTTLATIGKRRSGIVITADLELSDTSIVVVLLTTRGVATATQITVARVPCELSFADTRFDALFTDTVFALLRNEAEVYLEVRVEGVGHRRFLLQQDERVKYWWNNRICETDGGPVPHGISHATQPAATSPADDAPKHLSDVCLLVPLDDEDRVGAGLCIAPKTLPLYLPEIEKPTLLRQITGSTSSVTLETLFASFLNWTLADSEHSVAEIRRQAVAAVLDAWTSEVVCGSSWAVVEQRLVDAAISTVWQFLAGRLVDGASKQLASSLEASLPWLEGLATGSALVPSSAEPRFSAAMVTSALEDALKEYEHVAGSQIAQVRERVATLDWTALLAEWDRQHHLHELLSRVWPTDGQLELAAIAAARAGSTEIASDIVSWQGKFSDLSSHDGWDEQEVQTVLDFWVNPERVHVRPSRTVLSKLRNNVGMARALRYVSLVLRRTTNQELDDQ